MAGQIGTWTDCYTFHIEYNSYNCGYPWIQDASGYNIFEWTERFLNKSGAGPNFSIKVIFPSQLLLLKSSTCWLNLCPDFHFIIGHRVAY